MKIQLAPWETCETSISLSPSKRRRRRKEVAAVCSLILDPPSSKQQQRSLSKRTSSDDSILPALLLTTDHHIGVFGPRCSDDESSHDAQQEGLLFESSLLQYSIRPGAGFLHDETPAIPAVYDSKQQRIYVLRDQTRRLVSWSALSGGPDDEHQSLVLQSPAVSMSLLSVQHHHHQRHPQQLVYGSCQDGSIYMARLLENDWSVEYLLASSSSNNDGKSSSRHLATVAKATLPSATGKRKRTSVQTTPTHVTIFQAFVEDDDHIRLIRHSVELSPPAASSQTSQAQQVFSNNNNSGSKTGSVMVPLVLPGDTKAVDIEFVGFVQQDMTMTVSFRETTESEKENSVDKLFWTNISLESGQVCSMPFQVERKSFCKMGIAQSGLLVALSEDGVMVFDRLRGILLHSSPLEFAFDENVALVTDIRHSRIAIVHNKDDKVFLATSSVKTEDGSTLRGHMSLAQSLAASRGAGSTSATGRRGSGGTTESAVHLLKVAAESIRQRTAESKKKGFLQGMYERAVSILANAVGDTEETGIPANPQDAVPSKKDSTVNGVHHSGKAKDSKLVNGVTNGSAKVPSMQPQAFPASFVDAAVGTVGSLLSDKHAGDQHDDAAVILRRLVRSGRLSARKGLSDVSFLALLQSLEAEGKPSYSPTDLSFDLLRHCKDLPESIMVASVHYCLVRASAKDLGTVLLSRAKPLKLSPSDREILKRQLELGSKSELSEEETKTLDKTSSLTMVLGATSLLQIILSYSDSNESLLRAAARAILSRDEVCILCRMILEKLPAACALSSNAMTWLSVLSGQLRGSLSDTEESDLAVVRDAVRSHITRIDRLVRLRGEIENAASLPDTEPEGDHMDVDNEKESVAEAQDNNPRHLPPYQIERLLF